MNILKITCYLLSKNLKSFLLLLFQMILSAIILISLIGKVQSIMDTKDVVNIFNEENAFYFTPCSYYDSDKIDVNEILNDQINANHKICELTDVYLSDTQGSTLSALGYNDEMILYSNIKMKSGHWFDKNYSRDYIPIVAVGNKYKVGDIININSIISGQIKPAYVIGTIREGEYVTAFNGSGSKNNASLGNLTLPIHYSFIVPLQSKIWKSFHQYDAKNYSIQLSKIIIFNKEQSSDKVYSVLSEYGDVSNISVMKKNYAKQNNEFFIANSILLLVFTLLTLTGIGGVNSMINIKNEKRYIIYFIYGMTKKQCALVEGLRSGSLILFSYILFIIIYHFTPVKNWLNDSSFLINHLTFLFVLVYMILIYICSSLPFALRMIRAELIELYKEKA